MNSKDWIKTVFRLLTFFWPRNHDKITHEKNPTSSIFSPRTELIGYLETWHNEKEIAGAQANERILRLIRAKFPNESDDGNISWCGLFVGHCLGAVGIKNPNHETARAWLKFGKPTDTPKIGDLVILWRNSPNSWQGHVGFFAGFADGKILIHGGNQNDAVNIQAFDSARLLGFRNPF